MWCRWNFYGDMVALPFCEESHYKTIIYILSHISGYEVIDDFAYIRTCLDGKWYEERYYKKSLPIGSTEIFYWSINHGFA